MRASLAAKVLAVQSHGRLDESASVVDPAIVGTPTTGYQVTSGADLSLALPTGVEEDDILVLFVADFHDPAVEYAGPAGWTKITEYWVADVLSEGRISAFWKRAGASETDPVTVPAARLRTLGTISAWRNCVTGSSPIVDVTTGNEATTDNSVEAPCPTTTGARQMVISGVVNEDYLTSPTSTPVNASLESTTLAGLTNSDSGSRRTLFFGYGIKDTAGAVDDFQFTLQNGTAQDATISFALATE